MSFKEKLIEAGAAEQRLAQGLNRRFYPKFHLAAKAGWVNDPNGFCYALGQYHLFYQHHPYSTEWGPMHWGHAVSPDLVHWQHLPEALAPSEDYDRDGCFSGSAIEYEGKLYLIYTGHVYLSKFGDDSLLRQVQCLAVSEDGVHFEKLGVIIEPPEGVMHFRDPKVERGADGLFYVSVGARTAEDEAQVRLYRSADLRHWEFVSVLVSSKDHDAHAFMYECPDVFALNDGYAAITSPMGLTPDGIERNNPSVSQWMLGSIVNHQFKATQDFTEIDGGSDFYAPQTCRTPDGRRVLTAWMSMWHLPFAEAGDGWCGCFTFPREVYVKDGRLCQRPLAEIAKLHLSEQQFAELTVENGEQELTADASAVHLKLKVKADADQCGLRLGKSIIVTVDRQHQELTVIRTDKNCFMQRSVKLSNAKELELEAIIDLSSIEVFAEGQTLTCRCYPQDGDRSLRLFAANGSAQFTDVMLADLENAIDL